MSAGHNNNNTFKYIFHTSDFHKTLFPTFLFFVDNPTFMQFLYPENTKRVTKRASRFLILFNLRDFLQFNIIIYILKLHATTTKQRLFPQVIL